VDSEKLLRVNGEVFSLPTESLTQGRRLHRLGAQKRLQELERINADGLWDSAISALGKEQGLACSQTAFVAVQQKEINDDDAFAGPIQNLLQATVEKALRWLVPYASTCYAGHSDGGIGVSLLLLEPIGTGCFSGQWTVNGQTDNVIVTIHDSVIVITRVLDDQDVLWRGTVNLTNGAFSGHLSGMGLVEIKPAIPKDPILEDALPKTQSNDVEACDVSGHEILRGACDLPGACDLDLGAPRSLMPGRSSAPFSFSLPGCGCTMCEARAEEFEMTMDPIPDVGV